MIAHKQAARVLVVHGPNLNMLGLREPEIYGKQTLDQINADLEAHGRKYGIAVQTFQANAEGAIVDRIQSARDNCRGLIINPAAYTHTSVAIRDALLLLSVPIIEVHLSNIYRRERLRHRSVIADVVTARICGLGAHGYLLALEAMARLMANPSP
jgi:3-dehydroquinate dehydratase-2